MGRLLENPLDCEYGDAFPDDGRVQFWAWDIAEDFWACAMFAPDTPEEEIDPAIKDLFFQQMTVEIDGKPVDVAVRADPDNWTKDFPYGWKVVHLLDPGQ